MHLGRLDIRRVVFSFGTVRLFVGLVPVRLEVRCCWLDSSSLSASLQHPPSSSPQQYLQIQSQSQNQIQLGNRRRSRILKRWQEQSLDQGSRVQERLLSVGEHYVLQLVIFRVQLRYELEYASLVFLDDVNSFREMKRWYLLGG